METHWIAASTGCHWPALDGTGRHWIAQVGLPAARHGQQGCCTDMEMMQDPAEVMRIAAAVPLDIVQLSGTEGLDAVKHHQPGCLVKAVHVSKAADVDDILTSLRGLTQDLPHALLLDTKSGVMMGGAISYRMTAELVA